MLFLGSFLDKTINKAIYNQTIPFMLAASVHMSQECERKILATLPNSHNGLYWTNITPAHITIIFKPDMEN